MKTLRTRTIPAFPSGWELDVVFTSHPASWFGPLHFNFPFWGCNKLHEWIIEDGVGRSRWNEIEHYKLESTFGGVKTHHVTYDWNVWHEYGSPYYHDGIIGHSERFGDGFGAVDGPPTVVPPLIGVDSAGQKYILPLPQVDAMVQVALGFLMPGIKDDLSLVNSLLEFRDIKSLARRVKATAGAIVKALSYIGKTSSATFAALARLIKGGRSAHRDAANLYLEVQFGWKPLYSDVMAIIKSLRELNKRIKRELSNQYKLRRRHYKISFVLEPEQQVLSGVLFKTYADGYPFYMGYRTRVRTKAQAVFHVEVEYQYYYPEMVQQHAALLGLLDSLGVNLNPKIVWNAIPFSFVVDWVVNVSSFLDNFKLANMEPRVNITRCLHSTKVTRETSRSADVGTNIGIPCSFVRETAYIRTPFLPTAARIMTSGLTSKEFSLGVALAIQRTKRHKRR